MTDFDAGDKCPRMATDQHTRVLSNWNVSEKKNDGIEMYERAEIRATALNKFRRWTYET